MEISQKCTSDLCYADDLANSSGVVGVFEKMRAQKTKRVFVELLTPETGGRSYPEHIQKVLKNSEYLMTIYES